MRYQHLKIVRRISRYVTPVAPIIVALLLLFYWNSIPQFIRTIGHSIGQPIWALQSTVLDSFSNVRLTDRDTLIAENEALRKEVTRLQRITYTARSLQSDNTQLRELLGRKTEEHYRIPVSVIHGLGYSPYDTFVVDQGAQQGVRDGMLVLTEENNAIGYIQTTLEHTAVVRLFSASGLLLDVVLQNASSSVQHINAYGLGGGSIEASVPRDVKVTVGDEISLPSFQTYVLGQIVAIESSPEDAFKKLFIKNPVNAYELRYILVDTGSVWKVPEEQQNTTPIETTDNE